MTGAAAWQDPTLLDRPNPDGPALAAFLAIVESIPVGRRFTVNDLRLRLDAAEIPNVQRGGLFTAAVTAGVIEPVKVAAWGVDYDVRAISTGPTAKRATVRVYRRVNPTRTPTPDAGEAP